MENYSLKDKIKEKNNFEKYYKEMKDLENIFSNKSYCEFIKFYFKNIEEFRKINLPKLKTWDGKLNVVFVEFEKLPHVEYILRNNLIKLGDIAIFTVICGNNNYDMINSWNLPINIIKKNVDDMKRGEYSLMLTNSIFWEELEGEYILITRKESLILNNNITDFYGYDYIGTPWLKPSRTNQLFQGDGSFSLRKRETMIKITKKYNIKNMPIHLKPLKFMKEEDKGICIEDVYFSQYLIKEQVNQPSYELCKSFSLLENEHNTSFGIKDFYKKIDWKKFLDPNKLKRNFLTRKCLNNIKIFKWKVTEYLFDIAMIVYMPSIERLQNYKEINEKLGNKVNLFKAVDGKNQFNFWRDYGLKNDFFTKRYLKRIERPSKIGCNLSHQILLKEFINNSNKNWLLVLEDDINFEENLIKLNKICIEANSISSKFIQLVVYEKFREKQTSFKPLKDNLKPMIKQWGTPAYLIHKSIVNKIKTVDVNIDLYYSSNINQFNATFYDSKIYCEGSQSAYDNNKKFGSIIWDDN